MAQEDSSASSSPEGDALPQLSPSEFRIYNRMSEKMNLIHNQFRFLWTQLKDSCSLGTSTSTSADPNPATNNALYLLTDDDDFILTGLGFCSGLSGHHSIEEWYIFPQLALRMPEFTDGDILKEQHRRIHTGLVRMEKYLERCGEGEMQLDRAEVKRVMDGFGDVLWEHLNDEVVILRAENMRKYWSLEEMEKLPI
ncbi:hypothetical protein ARAM_007202 [Aspergillus rambellii]|uniref:Hemerythrin-like domain-containing protein n=1 Tax=Aspergillus rambellii TaxID=308745 RepID=A0A0F8UQK9_9EURO|nr:hypothetical protein ARAM_007202 [Aspergillus rambellii]